MEETFFPAVLLDAFSRFRFVVLEPLHSKVPVISGEMRTTKTPWPRRENRCSSCFLCRKHLLSICHTDFTARVVVTRLPSAAAH